MDEQLIWENEKGTFIVIIVRPNSKEKGLVHDISEHEIVLNLIGPAREGRANTELIKRLSKALNISSSDIMIVAGHKIRKKTLLLQKVTAEEVISHLQKLHNG